MDSHQFGAVWKGCFDLNVVDHLGDALHNLIAGKNFCTIGHQGGNAFAVAGPFNNKVADQGNGFRVVKLYTAFKAGPGHHGGNRDQQFIFFSWG